ncbi:hypothetical protein FRX31_009633 [Thalictrum thalictroides]|uniref:Uncharacterized protein n=1 Tax=Thalictrum thalictroides TaxID=46969 RepID=A0A7J6WTS4_THATH|nr:hypothetical protein FRX31_009633 [Thalictrum thalictroides]
METTTTTDLSLMYNLQELEANFLQQITEILEQQALHWKQKCTMDWYKFGDLDTKFFHGIVLQRRRNQFIYQIKGTNGVMLTKREEIGNRFIVFFREIMTTSSPGNNEELFDVEAPTLTEDESQCLLREAQDEEIYKALKQMRL